MSETITCKPCKGRGFHIDVRFAGVSHKRTEVRRRCKYCNGTGEIGPQVSPPADTEIGEIPAWMLGA